jgi:protein phosphatase PTC6
MAPRYMLFRRRLVSCRREFHDYFVTHLPSSSLHPDSRSAAGPRHQLPRSASKPHTPRSFNEPSPAPVIGATRETTVVRIPLKSAKHHFGVSVSRGQRPYNEDAHQAGVIEMPAFAKRMPISLTTRAPPSSPLQAYREKQRRAQEEAEKGDLGSKEVTSASGASGDPQVFYFAVFDGHGGVECSDFLRESLHTYIEDAARDFEIKSTLTGPVLTSSVILGSKTKNELGQDSSGLDRFGSRVPAPGARDSKDALPGSPEIPQQVNTSRVIELERSLMAGWKELVGGYFRRFKPALFSQSKNDLKEISLSTVLTYAFLRADLDFVEAQARKPDDTDPVQSDAPLNAFDVLHSPSVKIGGEKRFHGGSTCSIVLISTPSPTPFWHPSTPSSLLVGHVGDTRILLCRTSDGLAVPLTTNHHPNNPAEGERLRRYAGSFVTDSFGEERISGLANTRAFGDMQSKRIGVSAEPEIRRIEMAAAQYSFLVLLSDGVSGTLSDQEVVDIIKEAKTPEQGARDVVSFATEVTTEGDNATCICVRLGGWERRLEGGLGSMATRESRDYRKQEAINPRNSRQ